MRCPVFVGRARQLDRLLRAVDAAGSGRGAWLTVTGEAGIGKTRLVAEARRRLVEHGRRVAVGRCSPVDGQTPYRPLAEALLGCTGDVARPDDRPDLAPYLPAVARFVPHWRPKGAVLVSESPAVVGESVLRVLRWLSGGDPMLVVLEDLHWADADTVAVADYLADHLDGTPVVIVATARLVEAPPRLRELLERTEPVRLEPLSDDEVAQVAAGCLGRPPTPDVAAHLQRVAGGLPLLVEDLLDDDGAADGSPRFATLVQSRLDRLTPAGRRAVVAAALFGERFEWHQLESLVAGAGAVHEATAAQLLLKDDEGFRFRHALTRDVVIASLPALVDELSGPVAQVLEDSGRDDQLARAAELRLASGDPTAATSLLRRAALGAQGRGAPEAALALLERAAEVAPTRSTRTAIDVDRLAHLVARGQVQDAMALGAGLLDATATDPRGERHVRLLLARAALDAGRPDDAVAQLDAAPELDGDRASTLVLHARVALAAGTPDRSVRAEHLAHQAVAAAEVEQRPALGCEALDIVARAARSRSLGDAEAALRRSLALADEHGLDAWRLRSLNELGVVEMLRSADGDRLQRAYVEAMALGALDVAAGTAVNIAAFHAMRGDLEAARAASGQAEEAAARLGLGPLAAAATVMSALCDAFRGRREPMERRLARAEKLAPDDTDLRAFAWGAGRGLCALVREERDEARRAFRYAEQVAAPVGSLDTARGPLLLVLAADGEATPADVEKARQTATPGSGWSELWVGYGHAAVMAAGGDHQGAAARFAVADVAARRHPLFRAIGLRLLGEAGLRDGWGEPVVWLREAEAVFVEGGQDRIAGACRALLKQAGAPTTRRRGADRALPPALLRAGATAREAEVLELIGERLGNKEIAARLFLSPRTVEKHVASLLSKLAAADRAALVEIARRR